MGLIGQISGWPEHWQRRLTVDLEGLPRLGSDPFSIDVSYVLFEKRWVVQLVGHVSKQQKAARVVSRAGRTDGMLWFGAMAYVLTTILGREEG